MSSLPVVVSHETYTPYLFTAILWEPLSDQTLNMFDRPSLFRESHVWESILTTALDLLLLVAWVLLYRVTYDSVCQSSHESQNHHPLNHQRTQYCW